MAGTPQSPNRIGNNRFATVGNVEDNLTALAGGAQPTSAQALTAQFNAVVTVASGNDSVALPKITADAPGFKNGPVTSMVVVSNAHASNSVQVFGVTPDTINGVATGTGVALAAAKTAIFFARSYNVTTGVGDWRMVLSA